MNEAELPDKGSSVNVDPWRMCWRCGTLERKSMMILREDGDYCDLCVTQRKQLCEWCEGDINRTLECDHCKGFGWRLVDV